MLIKDYIANLFTLWGCNVSTEMIQIHMGQYDLPPFEPYLSDKEITHKVQSVLYDMIPLIIGAPERVQEGSFSASYDRSAILNHYKFLARSLGKPDLLSQTAGVISDITNLW